MQDYAGEDLIPFMGEKGRAGDRRERDRAVGDPMKDRVVLITNVEHFVGRPVAAELVAQGAAVVCHDKSFADAAAAEAFAAANPALTVVRAQTPAEIVARATEACGRVDVVVCNDAGRRGPRTYRGGEPGRIACGARRHGGLSVRDGQCGRAADEGAQAR